MVLPMMMVILMLIMVIIMGELLLVKLMMVMSAWPVLRLPPLPSMPPAIHQIGNNILLMNVHVL